MEGLNKPCLRIATCSKRGEENLILNYPSALAIVYASIIATLQQIILMTVSADYGDSVFVCTNARIHIISLLDCTHWISLHYLFMIYQLGI